MKHANDKREKCILRFRSFFSFIASFLHTCFLGILLGFSLQCFYAPFTFWKVENVSGVPGAA